MSEPDRHTRGRLSVVSGIDGPADIRAAHHRSRPDSADCHRGLLTVIIPTLNEETLLPSTLARAAIADLVEIIVADGGSTDRTLSIAEKSGIPVVQSPPGRANQMNAAAAAARGEFLLFLHADTLPPPGYDAEVRRILADPAVAAGAFRIRIAGRGWSFRVIERAVNLRSRWLSQPYGDQAIFMRRRTLIEAGGFPALPVMEDFAFIRRLRRQGRVRLARLSVATSARRWEHEGPWRTTVRNQLAIAAFLLGADAERIARILHRNQRSGKRPAGCEIGGAAVGRGLEHAALPGRCAADG